MPRTPRNRILPPGEPAESATRILQRLVSSLGSLPVRRESGRELALGPKAERTRAALLQAAHDVFCEHGYRASSVARIAGAAGTSAGTFYQYFRDRRHVLGTLAAEWVIAQLSDPSSPRWEGGREALRRSIRAFVSHYAVTVRFQVVWEEVTQLDPELASLRRQLEDVYVRTTAREITLARDAGHVRTSADPVEAARAVLAMINRYCYAAYAAGSGKRRSPSVDEATALLTELVANALRFEDAGERPARSRARQKA